MRPIFFIKKVEIVTFLVVLFATLTANSQSFILSGKVVNGNQKPLVGAAVLIKQLKKGASTDFEGKFKLKVTKGTHNIEVSYVGFKTLIKKVTITSNQKIIIILNSKENVLDEVLVSAVRVKEDAPITHSNLTKKEISKRNLGQDIPLLINYLPSVVVSSDAGAGVGYTYLRVRGSDASRINVTINGIPYNDAESQGTFWVNIGDFASSTQSLQLQRGVGTSTNGSGAFGASLNILTDAISINPYGEISNSFGSFGTRKHTVKFSTGKLNNHFELSGRLSNIHSDGYIDRASTNLKSYFLQGAYTDNSTLLKIISFGGKEKTYQAWNGITKEQLKKNRRQNPLTYENETDNYWQNHYQLLWNQKLTKNWTTNVALNYSKGKGYFEQFKKNKNPANFGTIVKATSTYKDGNPITDFIVRRWLNNDYYVLNFDATYKTKKIEIISGTSFSYYDGDHYGEVIWAKHFADNANIRDRYYFSSAQKNDYSIFSKITFLIDKNLKAFVDLQGRFVKYKTSGKTSKRKKINVNKKYNFFNPKIGLTYTLNPNNSFYASYGRANKEPNRNDFKAGITEHESLNDYELGWRLKTEAIKLNTNVYYMSYQNQLVLTGKIDDVGSPIRATSGKSYRLGLEIDADIRLNDVFSIRPNVAISQNKNTDSYINKKPKPQKLGNTNIAFSPNIVAGNALIYKPISNLQFSFLSKFVSEQYLSNTDAKSSKLDSYFTSDLNIVYELKPHSIFKSILFTGLVNNIFNKEYVDRGADYGGGYIVYFPQATINFLAGVTLKF